MILYHPSYEARVCKEDEGAASMVCGQVEVVQADAHQRACIPCIPLSDSVPAIFRTRAASESVLRVK